MRLFIVIAAVLLALLLATQFTGPDGDVVISHKSLDLSNAQTSEDFIENSLITPMENLISLVSSTFVLVTLSILYRPLCQNAPELMFYIFFLLCVAMMPSVLSGLIRLRNQYLAETSDNPRDCLNDICSGILAGSTCIGLSHFLSQESHQRDGEHLCAQTDTNAVLLYNQQFTFLLLLPVIMQFLLLPRQPPTSDNKDQ